MLFMYGYVALATLWGSITIGSFSMYISSIYTLTNAFNVLTDKFNSISYFVKEVDDFKLLQSTAKTRYEEQRTEPFPYKDCAAPTITFENVSVTYPNQNHRVLDNISIQINGGEKLAIVGPNGAGKTTFVKLLCRLYYPDFGRILVNGQDIQFINEQDYAHALAVVFQDYKIFSFTLAENVVLNQNRDDAKLLQAVRSAGLEQKLQSLPNGVETSIYKNFDENGIEFSGGESQKLAIARAYYKDASVVILDEPTASFDPVAEHEIYQKFGEISNGKTSIFISHRLASTRFCDRIAVFSEGKIVELDSPDELMEQNGLYRDMFDRQAERYRANEA